MLILGLVMGLGTVGFQSDHAKVSFVLSGKTAGTWGIENGPFMRGPETALAFTLPPQTDPEPSAPEQPANPSGPYSGPTDGDPAPSPPTSTAPIGVPVDPAVPEPATWAMMIGGLGMAGGIMRRNRNTRIRVAYA